MELDHLFLLTTIDAPEVDALIAMGLSPTYRREHVGQGTANVCFCFDNAFLEVLWVTSAAQADSAAVARLQLSKRAQWRAAATNPFGIAWRPTSATTLHDETAPLTWRCTPPYLPPPLAIDVAIDSDDLEQPSMFAFPGSLAPAQWPAQKQGVLQSPGGFTRLDIDTVWLPARVTASPTLRRLVEAMGAVFGVSEGFAIDVTFSRASGAPAQRVRLPL